MGTFHSYLGPEGTDRCVCHGRSHAENMTAWSQEVDDHILEDMTNPDHGQEADAFLLVQYALDKLGLVALSDLTPSWQGDDRVDVEVHTPKGHIWFRVYGGEMSDGDPNTDVWVTMSGKGEDLTPLGKLI